VGRGYLVAIALTAVYALVELIGGGWTGSLALVSDAGHMFSDVAALTLAAVAAWVSRRPASARHSFGLARAEVVGAAVNGILMLVVIASIVHAAIGRLIEPIPIVASWTLVIAGVGLVVNIIVAVLLSRGEQTLNTRAALLHVIGDLLGSVAAIASGAIVYFTGWFTADAWLSIAIALLILVSTVRLLGHSLHVLLEGVPDWIDFHQVREAVERVPGVSGVTQLRIWCVTSGQATLSAHLQLEDPERWPQVLPAVSALLNDRFSIGTVTLQPDTGAAQSPQPAASPRADH
jgi:cobalt-zinc-cadmium efflux system protein